MKFYETLRGVGLLEFLIGMSLLTLLVAVATPSFIRLHEYHQMRNYANQIKHLMDQARIESMKRRQPVYVHRAISTSSEMNWRVSLYLDDAERDYSDHEHNALATVSGRDALLTSTHAVVGYSPRHGRINQAGHFKLQLPARASSLKIIYHNGSGRIRVCSAGEDKYGYKGC